MRPTALATAHHICGSRSFLQHPVELLLVLVGADGAPESGQVDTSNSRYSWLLVTNVVVEQIQLVLDTLLTIADTPFALLINIHAVVGVLPPFVWPEDGQSYHVRLEDPTTVMYGLFRLHSDGLAIPMSDMTSVLIR